MAATNMVSHGGRIRLDGADVTDRPAHALPRAGLRRTFQQNAFFGGMTVLENMAAALLESRPSPLAQSVFLPWIEAAAPARDRGAGEGPSPGLPRARERHGRLCRASSPTARSACSRSRSAAPGARVVLLDEPAAGLGGPDMIALQGRARADARHRPRRGADRASHGPRDGDRRRGRRPRISARSSRPAGPPRSRPIRASSKPISGGPREREARDRQPARLAYGQAEAVAVERSSSSRHARRGDRRQRGRQVDADQRGRQLVAGRAPDQRLRPARRGGADGLSADQHVRCGVQLVPRGAACSWASRSRRT